MGFIRTHCGTSNMIDKLIGESYQAVKEVAGKLDAIDLYFATYPILQENLDNLSALVAIEQDIPTLLDIPNQVDLINQAIQDGNQLLLDTSQYKDLARLWAIEVNNVLVDGDDYSSKHYANESKTWATYPGEVEPGLFSAKHYADTAQQITLGMAPVMWHQQSVDVDIVIPPNQNAMSIGPTIDVLPNKTVTISAGSYWTIVNGIEP